MVQYFCGLERSASSLQGDERWCGGVGESGERHQATAVCGVFFGEFDGTLSLLSLSLSVYVGSLVAFSPFLTLSVVTELKHSIQL